MIDAIQRLGRSRIGRLVVALVGIGAILLIVRHEGFSTVGAALRRAAVWFPAVLVLEAVILGFDLASLWLLYGEERRRVPKLVLLRAGLIGYAVMGLVPAGRAFAEATKAALLARYTSGPRAAAAATQFQGVALLANFVISLPAAIATYSVVGAHLLPLAILGNALVTLVLGLGILYGGQRSGIGGWLGRRSKRMEASGQAFDAHLRELPPLPWPSILTTCVGRSFQVAQNAVLVASVGGAVGVVPALVSEGVHLVGVAVGDLIPGQLGATEANFTLSARALHLGPSDAVVIALVAHLAQMVWVAVGALVPLVWPAPRD